MRRPALLLALLLVLSCTVRRTYTPSPTGLVDKRGRSFTSAEATPVTLRLIGGAGEIKREMRVLAVEGALLVGESASGGRLRLPLSDLEAVTVRVKSPALTALAIGAGLAAAGGAALLLRDE